MSTAIEGVGIESPPTLSLGLDGSAHVLTLLLAGLAIAFAVPVVTADRGDFALSIALCAGAAAWAAAVARSRLAVRGESLEVRMLLGSMRFPLSEMATLDAGPGPLGMSLEMRLSTRSGAKARVQLGWWDDEEAIVRALEYWAVFSRADATPRVAALFRAVRHQAPIDPSPFEQLHPPTGEQSWRWTVLGAIALGFVLYSAVIVSVVAIAIALPIGAVAAAASFRALRWGSRLSDVGAASLMIVPLFVVILALGFPAGLAFLGGYIGVRAVLQFRAERN